MEVSNVFVVLMGLSTVFIGLISIILICYIMGLVCKNLIKDEAPKKTESVSVSSAPIQNKQEIIAGVSAVIAEELGTDVSAIKVVSFKRI